MALRTIERVFIALGVCAVSALCSLYITKSTAQSGQPQAEGGVSPIYGIAIPAGYREWRLISVNHLSGAGGKLKQVRAQLGNEIAIKAFREGTLPFPDGAIIAALHWNESLSDENNKVLALYFPAPTSNRPWPGRPRMFSSWSRTQRSTPQQAAGALPTSRTTNLATRRCTKLASPATSLPKPATTSSLITPLPPDRVIKSARAGGRRDRIINVRSRVEAFPQGPIFLPASPNQYLNRYKAIGKTVIPPTSQKTKAFRHDCWQKNLARSSVTVDRCNGHALACDCATATAQAEYSRDHG